MDQEYTLEKLKISERLGKTEIELAQIKEHIKATNGTLKRIDKHIEKEDEINAEIFRKITDCELSAVRHNEKISSLEKHKDTLTKFVYGLIASGVLFLLKEIVDLFKAIF